LNNSQFIQVRETLENKKAATIVVAFILWAMRDDLW